MLIQASIVNPTCAPISMLGLAATLTYESLLPSKLNACPTSPLAKAASPWSMPSLPPMMSLALSSPGHQLTKPDGGGRHPITIRVKDCVASAGMLLLAVKVSG